MSKRDKIRELKSEIAALKFTIAKKERELKILQESKRSSKDGNNRGSNLSKSDIVRYSRQMIIPQVGVKGQKKLKQTSVLIIGMGGLGCPAALYLAGAGVGYLGLVDYDFVEENNLHRQLLHNEDELGKPKVVSAANALEKLNGRVEVQPYQLQLNSSNALELVSQYDIVVDASDNVATRYLVSDACVLAGRPLVSGSALQLEGQLTVYNHNGGPCYRCLYPEPPAPQTVTNCSDAGVLGAVTGAIGTLQALEVVKIVLGMSGVLSSNLLLFDGENTSFRTIKLRKKNDNCSVCGTDPSVTQLVDYEQFCGAAANDKDANLSLLRDEDRITPEQLCTLMESTVPCLVVDVRQETEFQMCSIPGSINIPLQSLVKNIHSLQTLCAERRDPSEPATLVCMVCRRGNDSQLAVKRLLPLLTDSSLELTDLKGGLHNWAASVDPHFPAY
uniref:Adenylyltransferase and sulfurtransferase MOCS3 homolog n=1 Tax=Graphocephala atropunctata TaxID=36148 RepID=A0A1B6LZH7_9HEMI